MKEVLQAALHADRFVGMILLSKHVTSTKIRPGFSFWPFL